MDLERRTHEALGKTNLALMRAAEPRILLVSDDDRISNILEMDLLHAGVASERVKSMAAGCESARSGRFQVVLTSPVLPDGTWKQLTDLASRYRPGFVVIVVANALELKRWAKALADGAFDVLNASQELPRFGEAVRRALWAAYLEGAGPSPEKLSSVVTVSRLSRVVQLRPWCFRR
jgi:DNA-binding NtrC family response regulator